MTRITDIWHEYLCTFIVSYWAVLGMTGVAEIICRLNETTFSILSIF